MFPTRLFASRLPRAFSLFPRSTTASLTFLHVSPFRGIARLQHTAIRSAVTRSSLKHPHFGGSLLLAGGALALGSASVYDCESDSTKEIVHKDTGLRFPVELVTHSGERQDLMGLGLRSVTFLSFKVYVVGVYVPPEFKARLVAGHERLTVDELTERFTTSTTTSKSLLIISCRAIEGSHLRDGLARALDKFLPPDPGARATAEREVARFKTFFPKGQVAKGQGMTFTVLGSKLVMEFEGKVVGELESGFVAENLVRAYVGSKPVTKQVRDGILLGIKDYFADVLEDQTASTKNR